MPLHFRDCRSTALAIRAESLYIIGRTATGEPRVYKYDSTASSRVRQLQLVITLVSYMGNDIEYARFEMNYLQMKFGLCRA